MKSLENESKFTNCKTEEKTTNPKNYLKNKSLMQNQTICCYGARVKEIESEDNSVKIISFVS